MFPVPEKIARFYHVNDVKRFQHDRPVHKGHVDKENEFRSLWIERTIIDISDPLPNILRWFEIVDRYHFIKYLNFHFQLPINGGYFHRSFQELTPVEFACETMENVAKELYDLIDQYRADAKRNINPFSMRLQGIIDANVMGGISKYQDAFFNERFIQSAEGKTQQINVQRLKSLIMKQVQILETALELHGNLAPEGVQPLHKRLLERFTQMKQSLSGMERMKRQFSESIVNTPLPPLPVEKRSMSISHSRSNGNDMSDDLNDEHSNYHMMNFEKEEIYTRPSKQNGSIDSKQPQPQRCISSRDQNGSFSFDSSSAPPVPIRPKSAGYGNYDCPEIPPKLGTIEAPPLPPRGWTLDKRTSNPMFGTNTFNSSHSLDTHENDLHAASMMKSPLQKYSIVNIPIDDQTEADHDRFSMGHYNIDRQPSSLEFRDSGISTASNDLNYAYICSDLIRTNLNSNSYKGPMDSNANGNGNENGNDEEKSCTPPPIPRKMTNSLSYGMNNSIPVNFKDSNLDCQSTQTLNVEDNDEINIDGYCMPKINN